MSLSVLNNTQGLGFNHYHPSIDSSNLNKKWSLSKYGGLSASFVSFNGGNASVLSAPIGLQLNRRLNNNLYAFAGVSAMPAVYNFNHSFSQPGLNKAYPGGIYTIPNGLGMSSRVEMGLMYMNDQKTFSISGSIGVDRYNYPAYPSSRMNKPVPGSRP
jgi:hypothetical protein